MAYRSSRAPRPPLDQAQLEALALRYVGRYATTRAKLRTYLERKLAERGWAMEHAADTSALAERMAARGYVDDRAYAADRAASLGTRGYGRARVANALRAAGVAREDGEQALRSSDAGAWDAAITFARRRRIGPFAIAPPDRAQRQKALAAMIRAGHPYAIARRIVAAEPGAPLDSEE